ncbi:DUF2268 domain-containing putative Zn-dependent protease [uncultured Aquimarina sp.]|uniref:gliding motility protein GldB-related protein n=1 Tax=uncultured Aquimarina sp. TaxID=575652 RepID=UPI002620933F|nr:DUF2268 domain-containing putative Zn-dependent protease [uncultured Aquimarina sp.]
MKSLKKENKNHWLFYLLLIFLICGCSNSKKDQLEENKLDFDKAFDSFNIAKKHLKEDKDTLKAIDYFIKAAEYGYEPRNAYSNAIVESLAINKLDTAMKLAFKMADYGFRDVRAMDNEYFRKLKNHPKWDSLKLVLELNAKSYAKNLQDLNNVKLITSDIQNFWNAYDLASKEIEYSSKRAIYLNEYFEKGTVGLRDFTFLKIRNGIDQFVEFVESHRPYYDGIRKANSTALKNLAKVDVYFKKIDSIIPNATFPNYYFVMGCHTSFGTVSLNGSLIGLENVIDESTPIETLPGHRIDVVSQADFLPFVLIHELIHTYQNTSDKTLLGATIVEGTADFFTELVVGEPNPKPNYRIYGEANEKQIFSEFKENLENTNHINWIASRDDKKKKQGWPNDLSYFIGYKIAKGYYENSINKKEAIKDLLDIKNPHDILKKSKYQEYINGL